MRASDLPSPGILSNGQTLRHAAAHAISRAQINADRSDESDTAAKLLIFFNACAAACNAIITEQDDIDVTDVVFAAGSYTVAVAATQATALTFTPANATTKTGTYSSSDPTKATVSASGVITGVAAGTATITFRSNDAPLYHEAAVDVTVTGGTA